MGLIYVVRVESNIQDYQVSSTKYMQSPIAVADSVIELATLFHIWDQTNCLATHSNQNGFSSFENYKELAKTFTANGEIEVCSDGEYTASIGKILGLSAENSKKLKNIHDIDEVYIEDIFKSVFKLFKAVGLNDKFIQSVEVGNEQYALAVGFFNEKLNQGKEYKTDWLVELSELIG